MHKKHSAPVGFSEEFKLIEHDGLLCFLTLVGTEHKHSLALPKEGIEVKDAHSSLRYILDGLCSASRLIVDAESKDIRKLHVDACFLEDEIRLCRRIAQDTIDALIFCVSDGRRYNLYASLAKKVENVDERAALVLYEYG